MDSRGDLSILGSEFALLLRDSLRSNSTPSRRLNQPSSQTTPSSPVPVSPMSPLPPPTPKKPRGGISSLGIRLNIDMNESTVNAIPTSPTSPLPIDNNKGMNVAKMFATTASAAVSSPALSSSSSSTSPISSPISPRPSQSLPTIQFPPISLSSEQPPHHPLDVLASVSAQQLDNKIQHTQIPLPIIQQQITTAATNTAITKSPGRKQKSIKKNGKIFKCNLCPSTFSQQFNLNKHVRAVHERRRPFQCEVCHARFQQKSHRTMHYLAVHEKLRQFQCDRCPASFSWRGVLKKHRKSIHGIDE